MALDIGDHAAVVDFCQSEQDRLRRGRPGGAAGAPASSTISRPQASRRSGRSKAAAQLEGSKGFTKDLCREHNIPTAAYERFTDAEAAKAYVRQQGAPIVVKADGLAAGKGVIVADDARRRRVAAIDMMFDGAFGEAGAEVVIEEFLDGEEARFFASATARPRCRWLARRTTSASATATPARTPAAWAPIRRRR